MSGQTWSKVVVAALGCAAWLGGCAGQAAKATPAADTAAQAGGDVAADAAAAEKADVPYLAEDVTAVWQPGKVLRIRPDFRVRGQREVRGLIHAHTPYSHDACDDQPEIAPGQMNMPCFEDFRNGLCTVGHDFVMLTDHPTLFADHEYPDVLLYRPERGDQLVSHDGVATASRLACPGAPPALVLAGTEGALIAAGLEGHVTPTVAERKGIYGSATAEAIAVEKAKGAVSIAMHTEDWTPTQLKELPLDGFEMYNLHANLMHNLKGVVGKLGILLGTDGTAPHPDLILLGLVEQDERYVQTWGTVLASGVRRVTTMGTDCHRNALPGLLGDGERIDSYRRMMSWFSNHVRVTPKADGSYDDRDLKVAVRAGRLFGVFEAFGYPMGFDWRAEAGGKTVEMGGEVALAGKPQLRVATPAVTALDPQAEAPELIVQILRAREGGFDVVAEGAAAAAFVPTQAGAYRAEVRIRPRHLRKWLGDLKDLADQPFVWIMSNPIYVTAP